MSVSRWKVACVVAAVGLFSAAQVQAGPMIEFGEEGGYVQIDVKGQVYVENTDYGAGSDYGKSRTDIHFQRLRLSATGMLDDVWGFKFQTCGNIGTTKNPLGFAMTAQDVDWNDRDIRIIDGYGIANFRPELNFKVGLTKIPLTRANLDDCFAPLSLDRSMFVYSAYGSSPAKFSRDLGAVAWGGFLDNKLKYFAGVFQGREGQTSVVNPISGATQKSTIEPKSNFEYVGRVHYSFLDAEPGSGYLGTYFGEKKILTAGAGIAYEADAVYKNVSGTGALLNDQTVDYLAYAADIMFEYPTTVGVITTTAQYLKVDFDDAYATNAWGGDRLASIAGMNGQKEGGYGKIAYMLPFTIGASGKLQPYALYEKWHFAHLLGNDDQEIKQYGGGINYYIKGQNVRLTFEYLKTDFDKKSLLPVGINSGPGITSTAPFTDPSKFVDGYDTFRVMLQFVI